MLFLNARHYVGEGRIRDRLIQSAPAISWEIPRTPTERIEMNIRKITYIRSMVLAGALLALCAWSTGHPSVVEVHDSHCVQVGGGVLTNFLDNTFSETLGTATGDLSGGLGVSVSVSRLVQVVARPSTPFTIIGSPRPGTRCCSRTPSSAPFRPGLLV